MIYSYFTNDSGIRVKGKTFESMKAFINYAVKHPEMNMSASTVEVDLKDRAYSASPYFQS